MAVSASALRQNIYRLLDQVIRTGIPLEIDRKGVLLKIVPEARSEKLRSIRTRNVIQGDPEDLVDLEWNGEWKT